MIRIHMIRVEEPTPDPGRLIIDPHQHIWTEHFSTLIEHFDRATVNDFLSGVARSGHNIVATVHMTIQADYRDDLPSATIPVAETEYLDALADELVARRRLASDLSEQDKRKLFFDNASHIYRMGL
jgi:predicted TIM-barrel fold metal-dependent hydrolase